MLRLTDIMTRDVVTVSPQLSLQDAMALLTTRHISGAPVVAKGKVIGVVSLTDLAEFVAASPGVPTSRPDHLEWGEWDEAIDWSEGEDPPGAFFEHLWDDAGAEVVERIDGTSGPEWNVLQEHTVAETMNRKVCSLGPDSSVEEAADFMRRAGIHRVLVVDGGGALVGVVTTKDISDAVADHRITTKVYVFGPPPRM